MSSALNQRIGYVVKTYPRYSETFIVTEILAHEAAGLPIEIFALRPPSDTHFQNVISLVRAPVTYLETEPKRASDLWSVLGAAGGTMPHGWNGLESTRGEEMRDVYQAVLLAREARERGITHLHAHSLPSPRRSPGSPPGSPVSSSPLRHTPRTSSTRASTAQTSAGSSAMHAPW